MYRQLIVSGFHRSGTSMTMQALVNAGLHAGNSLIGANPSNSDGHYEDIETVNLHDAWLHESNSDWCHTDKLPQIDPAKAVQGIASIRDRLNKSGQAWGVKDPRTCLFLEHWFNALDNPAGVFIYRHYASCLHSLQKRHAGELLVNPDSSAKAIRFWTHPEVALESWLLHNNAILAAAKKHPEHCIVISQEAVISGAPVINSVNGALSMSLDTQCDSGVDVSKTSTRRELTLLKTDLKEQLEHTWEQLQKIAVHPADNAPCVNWVEPQLMEAQNNFNPLSLIEQWDRLRVPQSQKS